ncbi:MAG TPA: two-component system response regulator [Geomonas sp.]|nr:two-component system response regulator [Geomonas sp.]
MDSQTTVYTRPTILVVDDTPDNLSLMAELLKESYRVKVANAGDKGLKIARSQAPPDLILLDVMMPGIDGYEVCRQLKAAPETSDIPVIFLTACSDVVDETCGLQLGAVDYITKPVSPAILLARVQTHLKLKAAADFLRDQNLFLEREVARRTHEVQAVQEVTIHALASLAETRDNDTGNHLKRTEQYVMALALRLKEHPRFRHYLTDYNVEMLCKSAPLHDIGKVGIPDSILLKPGRLEPEEFEIMKRHSAIGRDALAQAEKNLGIEVGFLKTAKEIALSHHERWDGRGYPQALAGDAIPISARLMALADFYDALVCHRVYRPALPHEAVVKMISEGKGSHFDPDIADCFAEIEQTFRKIATQYADLPPAHGHPHSPPAAPSRTGGGKEGSAATTKNTRGVTA